MHAQFIPSLRTDLQRALLDAERHGPQYHIPAFIEKGSVALLLELLDAAVAAVHPQKGLVDAVLSVVGEVRHLEVEGGEMEMLIFGEGAVAGGCAGGFLGPGTVAPVVDDAVVARGLVDDFIVFVGFDWEAVGLVGEADLVVDKLASGCIAGISPGAQVVGDLDSLQVFRVSNIVGHSGVAEVGCLTADEIRS